MTRAAKAIIDLSALTHNFSVIQQTAPQSRVVAMVKADAYGHGMVAVAKALTQADVFGVASLQEAMTLRAAGITQPLLLLAGMTQSEDIPVMMRESLMPVIHHPSQLAMLEAHQSAGRLSVWLKLDTGMSRLGFDEAGFLDAHRRLSALSFMGDIELMTHFSRSEEVDAATTQQQLNAFLAVCQGLPGRRSAANSSAILSQKNTHLDQVRPGGALYGLSLFTPEHAPPSVSSLKPVMTLQSELVSVKTVLQGQAVGYGGLFVAPESMLVGAVAMGYGDGYPRFLSQAHVWVDGQPCPVIGRVSMDLMMVDLRAVNQPQVGDVVQCWGGDWPIASVAEAAGTISYDLTCRITPRVPRVPQHGFACE